LQEHGGQVSPETHAGHAQPQPPLPPPGTGFISTQRPLGGQGSVKHATPISTHAHMLAASPRQDWASVCPAQASGGGGAGAC
jgi:hypothetical protein